MIVDEILIPIEERIYGRTLLEDVIHPETGEVLFESGVAVDRAIAKKIGKAACAVKVKGLKPGAFTDECIVDLADSRIICGPDKLVTPQLIAELKRSSVDEIRCILKLQLDPH